MLDYSELTVVKNSDGTPTALGYPINSILLQNNKPLFVGGGNKKREDYDNLAVPAGLVCMTETICRRPAIEEEEESEVVPEGLYERLLELAEVKERKKMTKKQKPQANTHNAKSSTRKHKKINKHKTK